MTRSRPSLGFPCPSCHTGLSSVVSSRIDDVYLVRMRRCGSCGYEVETYEVPLEVIEKLIDRAKRARPFGPDANLNTGEKQEEVLERIAEKD